MEQTLTIREWLAKNREKYQKNSEAADACAEELKVAKKTVFNMISKLKKNENRIAAAISGICGSDVRLGNLGLSEQEFRAKHDSLYKLEQAVKALVPDKFIPETEFRATISIDPSKFRSKADLPQFDIYKGRVTGVTYWGHPRDIKRLKDEGVLQ